MAQQQSEAQKDTIARVMHEFKHGELKTNGGRKVKNPKQAIAVALHEAGASRYESAEKNRENLRRTKAKEQQRGETRWATRASKAANAEAPRRRGGETRADLYEEARRRGIAGRSKMSKAELTRTLRR